MTAPRHADEHADEHADPPADLHGDRRAGAHDPGTVTVLQLHDQREVGP